MNPDAPTPNTPPSPESQDNTPPNVGPTPTPAPTSTPNPTAPPPVTPTPPTEPPVAGSEFTSPSPVPPTSPSSNKTLIIVIVAIVVLALLGLGVFLAMKLLNSTSTNNGNGTTSSQTSNTVDTSTLTSAVLTAPDSATKGLTKAGAGKNPNAVGFTTPDQSCLVAYGTATPDIIAETTVSDFIGTFIKNSTDVNTTIDGPTTIAPRLLTDATDSSKKYSVPTMQFKLAEGAKHGTGIYSLALLKNNTRLVIETLCTNEQGNITQAQLDSMEAVVKQITVKAS